MKKIFLLLLFILGIGKVYAQNNDWDKFVYNFKNSDMVSKFRKNIGTVEIKSTDNSIEIISKGRYITMFHYSDGIITFSSMAKDKSIFYDDYWIANLIKSYAKTKNYNETKLKSYMASNNNLKVEEDGVEYSIKEVREDTEDSHSSLKTYSDIKMNIDEGIPKFNNNTPQNNNIPSNNIPNNNVPNNQNPNTGDVSLISIMLLLALLITSYVNVKKFSKFPQA